MGINKPPKQDRCSELLCCWLKRQWCCCSCLKPWLKELKHRGTNTAMLSIFHVALSNPLLNTWRCWVTFLRYPLLPLHYWEPENTAPGFGFLPGSQMNKRYGAGTRYCLSPPLVTFVQWALNLMASSKTKFPKQVLMLLMRGFMSVL